MLDFQLEVMKIFSYDINIYYLNLCLIVKVFKNHIGSSKLGFLILSFTLVTEMEQWRDPFNLPFFLLRF